MKTSGLRAYGLNVQAPFALPAGGELEPIDEPLLNLTLADPETVAAKWSGAHGPPEWQTMFPNSCHVRWERGREGDHLLTFGRRASFHLDRGGGTLLCAPAVPEPLAWQRFLLDTALPCVSSTAGFEALHASAVCTKEGVVAFVATRGGGKSTLAAELIGRGQALFCDDVLVLGRGDGGLIAHPGPPLMTLAADSPADREMGSFLGGETEDGSFWIHVHRAARRPAPLAAIFILERSRPAGLRLVRESSRPSRLLPHTLSLNRDPARALSRLGLLRELAAAVPTYRVGAPEGEVAELADAVAATLSSVAASTEDSIGHASVA
jgi:hypothetical protein